MADPTILYITSFNRSGSTLLGMLLGRQSSITFVGEIRNLNDHVVRRKVCYCGSVFHRCPFWSSVIEKAALDVMGYETKTEASVGQKLVKYASVSKLAMRILERFKFLWKGVGKEIEVRENILDMYRIVAKHCSAPVICDSSKLISQAKLMWMRYGERFKIIHLVRDGRGVANSVMKRTDCSIEEAARSWRKNNLFSLVAQREIPTENLLRLRYEDICRNTANEIAKVCEFAMVNFSESDFVSKGNALHFVGGSPTAKKNKVEDMAIECDEKWKDELSCEEKRRFERIAGSVNRLYGYS